MDKIFTEAYLDTINKIDITKYKDYDRFYDLFIQQIKNKIENNEKAKEYYERFWNDLEKEFLDYYIKELTKNLMNDDYRLNREKEIKSFQKIYNFFVKTVGGNSNFQYLYKALSKWKKEKHLLGQ